MSVLGAALLMSIGLTANAKEVVPMLGGVIIDGYDFKKDIGPKGSVAFNEETGEFVGAYVGLKMPKGRQAIYAWVHDTVNQKTEYIGPVGLLKTGTQVNRKADLKLLFRRNLNPEILAAMKFWVSLLKKVTSWIARARL